MNLDLFWPRLVSTSKVQRVESIKLDQQRIKALQPIDNSAVLLEEARRLYDQEQSRRATADNKAGIYIATITALLSIILSLVSIVLVRKSYSYYDFISVITLIMVAVNLLRAGLWAQKVIKVSSFNLLGIEDILFLYKKSNIESELIKKLLCALRSNYEFTNDKITYIKMTHALLVSVAFWAVMLIIVQITSQFLPVTIKFFIDLPINENLINLFHFISDLFNC